MFTRLSRWLVVCSVLFCFSGNASANGNYVSVYTLIDNGFKIVGTAGSDAGSTVIKALYQKRDSLFVCVLNHATSRCWSVPK